MFTSLKNIINKTDYLFYIQLNLAYYKRIVLNS